MTPYTVWLVGGPRDGEVHNVEFLGNQLRFPGDENDEGTYVLDYSVKTPQNFTFRWREKSA